MATIRTAIELYDAFTTPMMNIVQAVSMGVSAMGDMQAAMNEPVSASIAESITEQMNQAVQAIEEAKAALTEPVTHENTGITWDSPTMPTFTNTGIERFEQEIQSANSMLEQLSSTQADIASMASRTAIFPANMVNDMSTMQNRIQAIQERIQTIESNPLNFGTDRANAELEGLRSQLDQAVHEQNRLNAALEQMDVSAANEAYIRLSHTVSNTERYIRDNVDEQGRFNQEINEGISNADNLMNTIKGAVAAYVSVQSIGNALNLSDELTQTTARLNMMNDGVQSTDELVNMVYASAENARGSFQEMADVVARFGNNAGDAFGSTAEVVAFAELVQKQMTIAGASTSEAANAMLQLSQGLGSGVLRGDELNSIFEQAPNLIRNIANYLGVSIGEIREMASEGELTADVVKSAIFAATDEINANFEAMPMTWGQIWQSMQNTAIMAFQPVLQRLNTMANSDAFQGFVDQAINAMATVAEIVLNIFDLVAAVGGFIAENWSIISPIVYGVVGALALYAAYLGITKAAELASAAGKVIMCVAAYAHAAATGAEVAATTAATAAQYGLNTALLACPITWIIILIIALIAVFYAVIAAVNKFAGTSISATGIIAGLFATLGAHILNTLVVPVWNGLASLANFFGNVFNNPIGAVKVLFYDMCLTVIGYIANLAHAIEDLLNKIPGVTVDITSGLDNFYAGLEQAQQAVKDETGWVEYVGKMDYIDYGNAFESGYAAGEGIESAVENFSFSDIFGGTDIPNPDDYAYALDNSGVGSGIGDIAGNTGSIADSMAITEEEMKYLRDIAEQEAINRYTTAEITINQTNNNNVNKDVDLDGFVSGLTDAVNEAVDIITEGVHE